MVPTSLRNPEIVLPSALFWEKHGLPEPTPGRMEEPREYDLDGTHSLIDLSWAQWAPQLELDDIDKDPKYSQYPYQDARYDDEEEDMEVDERALDKAGGFRMTTPTSTRCSYYCPEATYSCPGAGSNPWFTP